MPTFKASVFKRFLAITSVIAYPLLIHASLLLAMPQLQIVAVIILLLGTFSSALMRGNVLAWFIVLLLSGAMIALGHYSLTLYALYLPPILIPLGLCILFGSSLLAGRVPLITAIATQVRGTLPERLHKYTVLLTRLWCGVFLGLVVWSIVLARFGSPEVWSLFTNFINYCVVGFLFVIEYIVRRKMFSELEHPAFFDYLRIIIQSNIRR